MLRDEQVDHQIWANTHHGQDSSYANYLSDLRLTWQHVADERGTIQPCAAGRQVLDALIGRRLGSLATCVPSELLMVLIESQVAGWAPEVDSPQSIGGRTGEISWVPDPPEPGYSCRRIRAESAYRSVGQPQV